MQMLSHKKGDEGRRCVKCGLCICPGDDKTPSDTHGQESSRKKRVTRRQIPHFYFQGPARPEIFLLPARQLRREGERGIPMRIWGGKDVWVTAVCPE